MMWLWVCVWSTCFCWHVIHVHEVNLFPSRDLFECSWLQHLGSYLTPHRRILRRCHSLNTLLITILVASSPVLRRRRYSAWSFNYSWQTADIVICEAGSNSPMSCSAVSLGVRHTGCACHHDRLVNRWINNWINHRINHWINQTGRLSVSQWFTDVSGRAMGISLSGVPKVGIQLKTNSPERETIMESPNHGFDSDHPGKSRSWLSDQPGKPRSWL